MLFGEFISSILKKKAVTLKVVEKNKINCKENSQKHPGGGSVKTHLVPELPVNNLSPVSHVPAVAAPSL